MKLRRRPASKKYPLIMILLLAIFGALAFHFFRVKRIECYSQFGPCPEEISRPLSHLIGWQLLRPLPVGQVTRDLSSFPQIKSISLYRRLPSVLVVAISVRHPLGAIGQSVLGAQAVADQEGVVFQHLAQSSLPLLVSPNIPPMASRISVNQLQSLADLSLVGNLFNTQVTGVLDGQNLTILAPGDLQIVVDVAQTSSNWYTPLQLILHRSKINAKMPHKIDLRFNDSVITY